MAPGPLLPVNVVADTLARSGRPDQQAAELAGLVSGARIATWAFAEPVGRWDAAGVDARRATERDGAWVLSGTKSYVQDAAVADAWLVTARTGDGLTQFLVPAGTPGVTVRPAAVARLHPALRRPRVRRRDGRRVGGGGPGRRRRRRRRTSAPGRADAAERGDRRRGQPRLRVHPRVRQGPHGVRSPDRLVPGVEAPLRRHEGVARGVPTRPPPRRPGRCRPAPTTPPKLVSAAKAYIGDRAPAIVQDCVQLHGGIGVTWEHDLHLYLRRVAQNAALYGSARDHRLRVATLLGV